MAKKELGAWGKPPTPSPTLYRYFPRIFAQKMPENGVILPKKHLFLSKIIPFSLSEKIWIWGVPPFTDKNFGEGVTDLGGTPLPPFREAIVQKIPEFYEILS